MFYFKAESIYNKIRHKYFFHFLYKNGWVSLAFSCQRNMLKMHTLNLTKLEMNDSSIPSILFLSPRFTKRKNRTLNQYQNGNKNVEFAAAKCKTFGIAKSIGYVKEEKSSIFAKFYLFLFCEAFLKGPKHEIFVFRVFMQSKHVWAGDCGIRKKI